MNIFLTLSLHLDWFFFCERRILIVINNQWVGLISLQLYTRDTIRWKGIKTRKDICVGDSKQQQPTMGPTAQRGTTTRGLRVSKSIDASRDLKLERICRTLATSSGCGFRRRFAFTRSSEAACKHRQGPVDGGFRINPNHNDLDKSWIEICYLLLLIDFTQWAWCCIAIANNIRAKAVCRAT